MKYAISLIAMFFLLGLSTAWRFARENGGDVRYEPVPGNPTRFIIAVPRAGRTQEPARKCA